MSNGLPIEEHRDILENYGLAFAWINLIEYLLGVLLSMQGNHTKVKDSQCCGPQEIDKLALGQKIYKIVKLEKSGTKLFEAEIIKSLWKLNENRKILAHRPTARNVGTGFIIVIGENDLLELGELLENTIERSKELYNELMNAIKQRPEIAKYLK